MKKLSLSLFIILFAFSIAACGSRDRFNDSYVIEQYEKEQEKEQKKIEKEKEKEEEKKRKEEEEEKERIQKEEEKKQKEQLKQEEKERKQAEKEEKEKLEQEEKERKQSEKEEKEKLKQEEKERKKLEEEQNKIDKEREKSEKDTENTTSTSDKDKVTSEPATEPEPEPEPDQNPRDIVDDYIASQNGVLNEEIPRYVMEAAYAPVLERVYGVVSGIGKADKADVGVQEACLGHNASDNLSAVGFAFPNLDGDTALECVIVVAGTGLSSDQVVEVYTIDGQLNPVLVASASSRETLSVNGKYPDYDSKIKNLNITWFKDYLK